MRAGQQERGEVVLVGEPVRLGPGAALAKRLGGPGHRELVGAHDAEEGAVAHDLHTAAL